MAKFGKITVLFLSTLTLSCLFSILFINQTTFAAAGPGNPIGGVGSGCKSDYDETWDTCFGGTWRYYSLNEPVQMRDRTKDNRITYRTYDSSPSSDRLVITDASDNVGGGTIHGCAAENSSGFFKFGLDVYSQSAGKSRDYHAGLVQKGSIKNLVDTKPSAVSRPIVRSIPADNEIPAFIANLGHDTVFSNEAMQDLFGYIEKKNANSGYNWNDPTLAWFCTGVFEDGGFSSQSHVRINSTPYANSKWADRGSANINFIAKSGETVPVTFSHDMKYDGTIPNPSTTIKKDWSYQLGVTGASVTMSPSSAPAPTSGNFAPQNGDPASVVATHTYNVTLPTVTSGQQNVTVCERITFYDKTFDGKKWTGGESYSRACANITVNASGGGGTPVSSCPLPDSSYSINKGGTQAASAVRNMSVGNTWQQTTSSNHTAIVWAKPGDSVQFKHTLCFGAQAVRGSNNPGGNGSSTPSRTITPSVANSATIKAFTTPATSGNYLFGKTLTGTNSQTFSLTRGSELPAATSGADEKGNYFFTYYSPSQKVGNNAYKNYECATSSFLTHVDDGYQIPGFANSQKPSNCKSVAASDVGKIVEQDLEWLDVKSWVTQYSSGGSTSCGCNSSNSTSASILSAGYTTNTSGYSPGYHVLKCYSTGSCGCCGEYCRACYTQYATTNYWYHPITTTSNSGDTKKAQVKIPYNYTTSVSTSINNLSGVVFAGEDSNISANVSVNSRSDNPDVPGNYATISKPTNYEIVAFTVPASTTSMPSHLNGNNNYNASSSSSACSYYSVSGGKCQSVRRESSISLNGSGDLNGASENLLSISMNIPDLEAGTKYCIALGVFPSNSHNSVSRPLTNSAAMTDTGTTWNYSKASCVTIAKKPSVHFYNSDIFSKGNIISSTSKKNISYDLPGNSTPCSFSGPTRFNSGNCGVSEANKNRRVFGSWAEYTTIAKGYIKNFGSGAAYGYENNNGGIYATPGGYQNVQYQNEPNPCVYSSQSFNNSSCGSKTIGSSNINPTTINLDRLLARYTSSATKATPAPTAGYRIDLSGTCILGTDSKYFPSKDGRSLNPNASYTCLTNGSKYTKIDGNASTTSNSDWFCLTAGNEQDTRTIVIDVSGTLTINNNFMYGNTSGSGCAPATYTHISELPQLLIFAENINIAANVTNIDAWLIADKGEGLINTCSNVASFSQLSADVCNKQLKINGPIFARKLLLNRTYGALSGHNSILPAEIFNFRNDAYYWAYSQAQRFSQSVTVYSNELAPRF